MVDLLSKFVADSLKVISGLIEAESDWEAPDPLADGEDDIEYVPIDPLTVDETLFDTNVEGLSKLLYESTDDELAEGDVEEEPDVLNEAILGEDDSVPTDEPVWLLVAIDDLEGDELSEYKDELLTDFLGLALTLGLPLVVIDTLAERLNVVHAVGDTDFLGEAELDIVDE